MTFDAKSFRKNELANITIAIMARIEALEYAVGLLFREGKITDQLEVHPGTLPKSLSDEEVNLWNGSYLATIEHIRNVAENGG